MLPNGMSRWLNLRASNKNRWVNGTRLRICKLDVNAG